MQTRTRRPLVIVVERLADRAARYSAVFVPTVIVPSSVARSENHVPGENMNRSGVDRYICTPDHQLVSSDPNTPMSWERGSHVTVMSRAGSGSMSRLSMHTFGVLVLPEEYWMKATSSSPGGVAPTRPVPANDSHDRTGTTRRTSSGTRSSSRASTRNNSGCRLRWMATSWSLYSFASMPRAGTGSEATVAPANHTASKPRTANGPLVRIVATRAPGRRPAPRSPAVIDSASVTTADHGAPS